jgi:hypothetical protein
LKPGLQKRIEVARYERGLEAKARGRIPSISHPRKHTGAQYLVPRSRGGEAQGWHNLHAPVRLDLVLHREQTCAFFSEVRQLIQEGRNVRIVFMDTESISAEALIYLLGQVHRLRILRGAHRITGTYPKSQKVERLFEESGFLDTLGVNRRGAAKRASSHTRYLECKSDVEISGKTIPKLRSELLGPDLQMPGRVARTVYRALTEAMINVKHHAYHNKSMGVSALQGRWWLGAQLSRRKNLFTLTFYDAGVGIPKTLPRRYGWEQIRGILSLLPMFVPDDGQMIMAAVELGRTRTKKDNRGKGLMDLLKLIDQVGSGSIRILSRHGSYIYEVGHEARTSNDDNFVEGTLIKWELPLNKAVDILEDLPNEADDEHPHYSYS